VVNDEKVRHKGTNSALSGRKPACKLYAVQLFDNYHVFLRNRIDDNMSSTSSPGSLGSLMNQANQGLSDSDEECIRHEYMNVSDDEWHDSLDEIELEYVRSQRRHRQGRRVLTWLFRGDILECREDTHPIPSKRWSSLPQDVQDANWISFCRCRRPVF
jgi:hypothetical protein